MSEAKAFPHPVLSPSSLDYRSDIEYKAEVNRGRDSVDTVHVRHTLTGNSLIARAIKEGQATFACVVSLPSTMYRRLFYADSNDSKELEHSQPINFSESGNEGNATPMFWPLILHEKGFAKSVEEHDGLSKFWKDQKINVAKGAIVAFDQWQRFGGDMGGILEIVSDEHDKQMEKGEIRVEASVVGEFRFLVHVNPGFYTELYDLPPTDPHRRNVLIHALGAGFGILQREYPNGEDEHVNLEIVAKRLQEVDAGHWGDTDFSPEYAATRLYPHILGSQFDEEDDED